MDKERGNIIKRTVARRLFRAGALSSLFLGCLAILHHTVWAAVGPAAPASAQATVGPVPLLAALAIGIAVAVGSVVAFLQMTAKGRDQRASASWSDPEPQSPAVPPIPASPPKSLADYPDDVSNYTIPLDRIEASAARMEAQEEQPRLCGVEGVFAGSCFDFNGPGLSIGRDPAVCSIVFPVEIGEVSRRHCTLTFERGRRLFLLEDHGSSNGTFLSGGRRLEPGQRYELRSGERFALSGSVHWFEVRA